MIKRKRQKIRRLMSHLRNLEKWYEKPNVRVFYTYDDNGKLLDIKYDLPDNLLEEYEERIKAISDIIRSICNEDATAEV